MRGLDSKVRAQRIYLTHMKQKLNPQMRASAKRQSQKRNGAFAAEPCMNQQRSRIEINESLRDSRNLLSKADALTPTVDDTQAEMVLIGEVPTPREVELTGANTTD